MNAKRYGPLRSFAWCLGEYFEEESPNAVLGGIGYVAGGAVQSK